MEFVNVNRICRLCLKTCNGNFEALDEMKQEDIYSLELFLNMTVNDAPIICETCVGNINHCLDVKAKCIIIDNAVVVANDENNMEIDIPGATMCAIDESTNNLCIIDGYKMCQFCSEIIECNSFVTLDEDDREMMWKYFSELQLHFEWSEICASCYKSLQLYFVFARYCMDTEEKIREYCKAETVNEKEKISLVNVITFASKKALMKAEEMRAIYEEGLITSDKSKKDSYGDIKEEIIIKTEVEVGQEMDSVVRDSIENDNVSSEPPIYTCEACDYCTEAIPSIGPHVVRHKDTRGITHDHDASKTKRKKPPKRRETFVTLQCQLCDYHTISKPNFRQHSLVHKSRCEVTMHRCAECGYESKYKKNVRKHMLTHQNSAEANAFKCSECDFTTKYASSFADHALRHKQPHEVAMHKCPECSYETRHKRNIRKHQLVHRSGSEVPLYKCEVCPFETKRRESIRNHAMLHKPADEVTMHQCAICGYRTRSKRDLGKHAIVHKDRSEVVMYACAECAFATKRRGNLDRHMLTHRSASEVTMYKCELCSFETKHKVSMPKHLATHRAKCQGITGKN